MTGSFPLEVEPTILRLQKVVKETEAQFYVSTSSTCVQAVLCSRLLGTRLGAELAEAHPQPLFSIRKLNFRRSRIVRRAKHCVIGVTEG
jgi:hypothetical protein